MTEQMQSAIGHRKMLALGFLAVTVAAPAAKPQNGQGIQDFQSAGIHVIFKPVTANDVISVQLFLKGGSAALTPGTAGIENLLVSTATLGTRKYTKDQFEAMSTSTGSNVSGSATSAYTSFSLRAVRQHWDEAWDLFSEAVVHPTFPKDEVVLTRDQIVNDLKQRTDDPDSYLNLLSDSVTFAGHPYRFDPLGTPGTIAKFTRDDLARWHKRRLTKENLLVVVVGNVSREDLERKVLAAFGDLPRSGGAAAAVPALAAGKASLTVVQRDLPTNYIQGLYVAPSRTNKDNAALVLASRLLSDRLFEEVRTKRNLTYAVGAGYRTGLVGRGTFYVTAVQPETTLKVIMSEVRRLQREPVPLDRLQETMNEYVTAYWMGQETNASQAQQLGAWELTGGGWRNALTMVERMKALTPADVQRVANSYMKNVRFVVIGNPKKIDRRLFTSM
jgi:zinc protease